MMLKTLAVAVALGASFFLGAVLARVAPSGSDAETSPPIPAAAQRIWFPPIGDFVDKGPLDEASLDALLESLEAALTHEETLADFETEADLHLWSFIRRLALPEVAEDQQKRIKTYLDELIERHPDHEAMIRRTATLLDSYADPSPAKRPPSFSGRLMLLGEVDEFDNDGQPFEDRQVDLLVERLDALLSLPEVVGDFANESSLGFWRFGNRLQMGRVTPDQTKRIVRYLDELTEKHPEAQEELAKHRFLVRHLIPGNVAPNIAGTDTDGVDFQLEDYRGKIVALVFSGQWCGPCRVEYPYQRAMLDIYDEEDVVILGVNSDAELETIRRAKIDEELSYRTWWDGHSQPDADVVAAEGPIATEWSVQGWPTIYVIDGEGVIRHVNKRGGGLIAAVDELLNEKRMAEYEARMEAEVEEAEEQEDADEAEDAEGPAAVKIRKISGDTF